ncbi:porin [Guyparkeria hydrothermalis]|uniref:porin n=1 Tax=Guyparkeria hydrothermalis TaxID=923 RepID=UPI0020217196|nr:porin [Guyparkeria hydrothermalis]MCL7745260.1 porin [Guyparkeria hydrothermalis]
MKKNIIAMAVAAAVAAPAAAMADTTLYGKIHASYDFWGGDNADDQDYSLASNSSRIGVKGKEEISDNLALIYQWETGIDFGGNGDGIGDKTRNTFVGFTGDWGTAIAGRHDTPFKKVGRKYDLFGDTVGDSRAIIRTKNDSIRVDTNGDGVLETYDSVDDWDRRTNNTVAYMTPDLGGFSAVLAYVSDWDNGDQINNEKDAYSISAGYEIGGFMVDAAYEVHNTEESADPAMTDDSSAYRVGAGYKIGGFKIVGLYQQISDVNFYDGADVDGYGVGAAYGFGNSTIKAQYYMHDDIDGTEDTDADMWAVGYDYKLSKQTKIYAVYASMQTGDNMADSIAAATGHGEAPSFVGSDGTTGFGADSNAFSVGVIHKF